MINPHLIEPKYRKFSPYLSDIKVYLPVLGRRRLLMSFRRATEALDYAKKVHARWCRLYDAAMKMAGEK